MMNPSPAPTFSTCCELIPMSKFSANAIRQPPPSKRSGTQKPDLVFLDVRMPEYDGFDDFGNASAPTRSRCHLRHRLTISTP